MMKVLNFLEWYAKHHKPNNVFECDNVYTFYSQSFKPEMITELFEGWTKGRDFADQLIEFSDGHANHFSIETHWDKNGAWSAAKYLRHCAEHRTTVPLILDTFISDCQRAGIELEWKPEIERKYFK